LQTLGLPVQAPPAVQATQAPLPSQTMFVPQLTPPDLLPPSMHVIAPDEQEVAPFLQMLGLVVHDWPAVQPTQLPLPSQTRLLPQFVPACLLLPSTQVIEPLEQEVAPFLQMFGLPVHDWPVVQATHMPLPLQTRLVPQPMPGDLLLPSVQVMAPVEQAVVPFRQLFGLPVQDWPTVQATQVPLPLQTMLLPQLVPAVFAVPFTQVDMPVEQDAVPL